MKTSTLEVYKTKLELVNRALGWLPVDAVELEDVERAFSRWIGERGPSAADQALRLLRSLLELAVRKHYRVASAPNPASLLKQHRAQSPGRALTPKELERVGRELTREEEERQGQPTPLLLSAC